MTGSSSTNYDYKYNDYGAISFEKAFGEHTARSAEFQEELGLGLYDYGARNNDAALGSWMNMDPLSEKYYNFSTYTYAENVNTAVAVAARLLGPIGVGDALLAF